MLRLIFDPTLYWGGIGIIMEWNGMKFHCITLVNMCYSVRVQYLLSIHSWDSSPWQMQYFPNFYFFLFNFNVQCHAVPIIYITACFVFNPFCKCVLLFCCCCCCFFMPQVKDQQSNSMYSILAYSFLWLPFLD